MFARKGFIWQQPGNVNDFIMITNAISFQMKRRSVNMIHKRFSVKLKVIVLSAAVLLPSAALAAGGVQYAQILGTDESVTGVRGDGGAGVVLTGSYQSSGATQGLLYRGPLFPTKMGTIYTPVPTFSGQTVTSSLFYGPNTFAFDRSLGVGNVRMVGSYQQESTGSDNYGFIYEGPLYSGTTAPDGATWTEINVPSSLAGGTVQDTIPHSTMGDLVVGNYDLASAPLSTGNAFIYNIRSGSWQLFDFGGSMTNETTAYAIWHNGGNSYTIAGGTDYHGIQEGFLVDYDSVSEKFSHMTLYEHHLVTHFEGITGTARGFNLIATTATGAAFASVTVKADGSFSDAAWTPISYPGSKLSTGNSVYKNVAMGIYTVKGSKSFRPYIAAVSAKKR
jgi:hypothetical protein